MKKLLLSLVLLISGVSVYGAVGQLSAPAGFPAAWVPGQRQSAEVTTYYNGLREFILNRAAAGTLSNWTTKFYGQWLDAPNGIDDLRQIAIEVGYQGAVPKAIQDMISGGRAKKFGLGGM